MSDKMRPVPFTELIERVFSEYRNHGTIFGIHKDNFHKCGKRTVTVFGQKCATPLGPAAGPHTQLAQNIISAYLTGGRFMELKTVQIMDYLGERNMISKPCIDARDEGFNVEWSTEYTIPKAYDEYLKAWFVLHVIQAAFSGKKQEPDFIFNMSVGYNLDGIKQPKMQNYIDCMIDASKSPLFEKYKTELKALIDEGEFWCGTDIEQNAGVFAGLEDRISPNISPSVTISTMHGCPPAEIEAICAYMMTEKHLNTFVKLNPTLLGYDAVREILDRTGFDSVELKRETFEHDLQYPDAVSMLHRLAELAEKKNLGFGVKLTNTLANVNNEKIFEGEERYMSGRALLPISTAVAAKLSAEFDGKLPISYSGGATAFSVKALFDTGIRPITVATDMLKPGGYARLGQMAEILENESSGWEKSSVNADAVKKLSEDALKASYTQQSFRGNHVAKTDSKLPMFDCFISPCMTACPIHQDIPDYVSLVGEGKYAQALAVIYEGNALPNITCNICDHQCQFHCARMDYEGSVNIRELKKIAVEKGSSEYLKNWESPVGSSSISAAVVGAGPAGLSAAYFLARSGFKTTVFEKARNAGGVVANIIPKFRIDEKAILADIEHVKAHGVEFRFGVSKEDVTKDALKSAGFNYIFYAIGAELDNKIEVDGDVSKVTGALEFLDSFRKSKAKPGRHVVVTGGGNTAMDTARAARRCEGVEDVSVVYRRSSREMPADPEEFAMAQSEGVRFYFLANPRKISNGTLTCVKMALGEADTSGRRRPVETGETFEIPCDSLLTATGEHVDTQVLSELGIPVDGKGRPEVNPDTNETKVENVFAIGDMVSGPSTVVRCIASARKAVEAVLDRVLKDLEDEDECCCGNHDEGCCCNHGHSHDECGCGHHHDGCSCHGEEECCCDCDEEEDEAYLAAEDGFFRDVQRRKTRLCTELCVKSETEDFARQEAGRCMDCTYFCSKCVDVCPNRANVAIDMRFSEFTEDPFQILHIDAFCNECGNCAAFCNHQGKPYRDKFTLFSRRDDFEGSSNCGFYVEGDEVTVRLDDGVVNCRIDGNGNLVGEVPDLVRDLIEQVFISYNYLLGSVEE